jgi:hypothetical protein
MRLISVVESMLALPKPAVQAVPVEPSKMPKDSSMLDPAVEEVISRSASNILRAIEDMPVDEIAGVTSDGL